MPSYVRNMGRLSYDMDQFIRDGEIMTITSFFINFSGLTIPSSEY